MTCQHAAAQSRAGEDGAWCTSCGEKVLDVDHRECRDCAHYRLVVGGSVCKKHLMVVVPEMRVTYSVVDGTCFEQAPAEGGPQ